MSHVRPPLVNSREDADGNLILTSGYEPLEMPESLAEIFLKRAEAHPDRILLGEKDKSGQYQTLSYGEARDQAFSVASWLLEKRANIDTPVMILSGASHAHLVMSLGAMFAQVPTVPVSMSYSSVPAAFPKLKSIFDRTQPAYVFSTNFDQQLSALEETGILSEQVEFIGDDVSGLNNVTPWRVLRGCDRTEAVETSIRDIHWGTVFKYMFTSGSTGEPKGVIHNHGMMCAMLGSRDETSEPSRVLDWMPWSHVGAGVMRLATVISSGGCIYIDDGKPVPGEYHKTLENIRVVKPNSYAGAPLGWNMLVDALEKDDALATIFFENVKSFAYGSAAMPVSTYGRLQNLLVKYQGARCAMSTSLQSTEVAVGISRYWPCEDQTVVGLPMPGAELKLLPVGDRYELRVRSIGVTPGYINDPEKSKDAFDEQGFFKMGDAVTFADPNDFTKGLRFAGRIAEQFKLVTGTWVAAGTLRAQLVAACAPLVRDVVICGLNQSYLSAMIWLNVSNAADIAGTEDPEAQVTNKNLVKQVQQSLQEHNEQHSGSSQRIKKFVLLAEPPSIGDGEITEKGYVNQGAVQRNRAALVDALYGLGDQSQVYCVD